MHVLFAKIQVQKAMELESFFFAFLPTFFAECLTVTFLLCILPGITHKLYV